MKWNYKRSYEDNNDTAKITPSMKTLVDKFHWTTTEYGTHKIDANTAFIFKDTKGQWCV